MREPMMVKNPNFDKIKDMDYCKLVVDELKRSDVGIVMENRSDWKYIEGFSLAPVSNKRTPRLIYLNQDNLKEIAKANCTNKARPTRIKHNLAN